MTQAHSCCAHLRLYAKCSVRSQTRPVAELELALRSRVQSQRDTVAVARNDAARGGAVQAKAHGPRGRPATVHCQRRVRAVAPLIGPDEHVKCVGGGAAANSDGGRAGCWIGDRAELAKWGILGDDAGRPYGEYEGAWVASGWIDGAVGGSGAEGRGRRGRGGRAWRQWGRGRRARASWRRGAQGQAELVEDLAGRKEGSAGMKDKRATQKVRGGAKRASAPVGGMLRRFAPHTAGARAPTPPPSRSQRRLLPRFRRALTTGKPFRRLCRGQVLRGATKTMAARSLRSGRRGRSG